MSKSDFVVIAEFKVKPGKMSAFLEVARDDALHSVRDEVGCQQFDVTCLQDESDVVVLYEVYDSRAAFDTHRETPHLARFRQALPDLIVESHVRFADRHYP